MLFNYKKYLENNPLLMDEILSEGGITPEDMPKLEDAKRRESWIRGYMKALTDVINGDDPRKLLKKMSLKDSDDESVDFMAMKEGGMDDFDREMNSQTWGQKRDYAIEMLDSYNEFIYAEYGNNPGKLDRGDINDFFKKYMTSDEEWVKNIYKKD